MKILVTTDFSANAKHAAEYAYHLAIMMAADLILCNAVIIPAETPQAGLVVWPMEEAGLLLKDSTDELEKLKKHIEKEIKIGFKPSVTCINLPGTVTDIVKTIVDGQHIDLVISGTHASDGLSAFLLGNHARNLIDNIGKPLLLIPETAVIGAVKKIAFATDFKFPDEDLKNVFTVISLARPMNSEILISHIDRDEDQTPEFQKWVGKFMTEISNKADYPNIYYRTLKSEGTVSGLEWLCKHGNVDILTMVHRTHNLMERIFTGSQTQKMAGHIDVPLLVFSSAQ